MSLDGGEPIRFDQVSDWYERLADKVLDAFDPHPELLRVLKEMRAVLDRKKDKE